MEQVFQACIHEVRKAGSSVLLSSHILSEVEKLCDKVSIIRQGQIIESGTLQQLRLVTMLVAGRIGKGGKLYIDLLSW
jgi:ABC-2 type transport system ATP-binding protein